LPGRYKTPGILFYLHLKAWYYANLNYGMLVAG
jgi:hypothetical protein